MTNPLSRSGNPVGVSMLTKSTPPYAKEQAGAGFHIPEDVPAARYIRFKTRRLMRLPGLYTLPSYFLGKAEE